jgi:hypothetical protein
MREETEQQRTENSQETPLDCMVFEYLVDHGWFAIHPL